MNTYHNIMNELKKGIYRPIYLLMGEEVFFIDQIAKYIEKNALPENLKDFNKITLYAKDISTTDVITTAKRFPMMADRFVVFVKEAQHLKKIDNLIFYTQKPNKSTVLVIEHKYKSINKQKKWIKEIEKNGGIVFEAKKLYENQIPNWINNYINEQGYNITPQAALLLTEYLGTDLSKITNELEKIFISYPKQTTITDQIIKKNIGVSKEYSVFELQKAIGQRDTIKAYKIADYFAQNPKNHPLIMTINSLYFYFIKILKTNASKNKNKQELAKLLKVHPYFVNEYLIAARNFPINKAKKTIALLREYDLKSKKLNNVSTNDGQLLKELIFRIFH